MSNCGSNKVVLVLAYNDGSLRKGGRFDIGNNFMPPHHEHMAGTSQDVRANGGPSSVPFDNNIRAWFTARVQQLFGVPPLHEGGSTPNEHYHIR